MQMVQLGATLITGMGFIVLYPLYFCVWKENSTDHFFKNTALGRAQGGKY